MLIRKFSLYSFLIIVLLGVVLNLVISYKIENMVIERTKSIDRDIYDLQFTIATIIFLVLGALYFSLIWMVKEASATILNQNIALSKAFEDFKTVDIMKSHFINTMSHELRTPLNSIIGFSDILKQKTYGELNDKQEKYLDNILRSGRKLLALVNDILDLIIIEAGKLELVIRETPVNITIDENIELIRSKAEEKNVTILKEIDPQLQLIEADKEKFSQILQFLLDNAVKFSKPEGGVIKIIALKTGNMAQFSISDTGIGIKEENMEKLFQAFQQIDSGISREYSGTGLGLSISLKLVELHGGKIRAESKYGEGTIVTFQIPIKSKNGGAIS